MDKRRRAERLIASLRWLVIILGLMTVSDAMPRSYLFAAIGLVAVYNGLLIYCLVDADRFAQWGRKCSIVVRLLDTVVISLAVMASGPNSLIYLLYWFVLISFGFTSSDTRKLSFAGAGVICANAIASIPSFAFIPGGSTWVSVLGTRSGFILFGFLVAIYVAQSRSKEELASDRGSYLQAILDCGAKLTSFRSVHELALYVLGSAVNETATAGGELLMLNADTHELECEAFYSAPDSGTAGEAPSESQLRSYANWVMGSRREFLIKTGGKISEDQTASNDQRPAIAVPLLGQSSDTNSESESAVLGVLIVWGYPGEDFADDAQDILRIFAAITGAAIINLRLYTDLQKSFLRTLQSLAKGLEARDEYTSGHSERVMQIACLIAEQLDVPSESMDALRNASLLHDIGKIGVPDAILRKAGKLTAEEWEAMRRHPILSEQICRPLGLSEEILFLILHHHERLDGKGYPANLPPQEQPLLQRILVVADSFDAMRSRRPYRDRMPQDELLSELNRSAGRTLDPTVVDALMRLMEQGDVDPVYEGHDYLIDNVFDENLEQEAA